MDPEATSNSAATPEGAASPDTQVAALAQRLDILEKKAPSHAESRFLRFGAIAGVLGTLISIVTGGLTVYSNTFRQSVEDKNKLVREFEGYIQQIILDNQKISTIWAGTGDIEAKVAQSLPINSEKYVAANAAERIMPFIEERITVPQYVYLATEKARIGDFSTARKYLGSAVNSSEGITRAEVLRVEGSTLIMSNDAKDREIALHAFSEASEILKTSTYLGASMSKAQILAPWIQGEANWGDCNKAKDLISEYITLMANDDMKEAREFYKKGLRDALAGQKRCQLDLARLGS